MKKHLTDGELRAAQDGELEEERSLHLKDCVKCQARNLQLQQEHRRPAHLLGVLTSKEEPVPNAQKAWARFSEQQKIKKESTMFKKWFAFPVARVATAALLIVAVVLAFPGGRAFAGELLNLFRVQQVTVVPVDFTGLEQLTGDGALGNQFTELISNSIHMDKKPGDPVQASSAEEASKLSNFTVRLPQGKAPSQIYVTDPAAFTVTVDKKKAQSLLDEAGRSDLVLPDSIDGADISVQIPASVSAGYGTCPKPEKDTADNKESEIRGRRYRDCVMLVEMQSPSVNAPADLDVNQLAQIGLEFTGMTKEDAAAFTSTVNWTSTLVIPIPKNAANYEQVTVDGVTGTLIERPADDAPQFALIWVKDGIVYAISGLGANSQQAMDLANSLP